jgi:ribosomal protein S18 acetylase RimI-like enzyme
MCDVLSERAPHLALRQVQVPDQSFLDALYASSREDLHALSADPQLLASLIQMQQRMQQAGFAAHFPNAQHWIVQSHGQTVGRLVVDVGPLDVRVVDIAIAPAARRTGVACTVLQALQAVASTQQLRISLAVNKTNTPAQSLYRSLGFTVSTQDELLEQMVWGQDI